MDKIAIIIPCYRETAHILSVIHNIPDFVWRVYVVDDACPEGTGALVKDKISSSARINVIFLSENIGVGGAFIEGAKQAISDGAEYIVKVDGDGQMDLAYVETLVNPMLTQKVDYCKGNRFFSYSSFIKMPFIRLIGNATLSLITKFSSGYWSIMDPTNGYVAIRAETLKRIDMESLDKRFFFESDLLCKLYFLDAVVVDVCIPAVYGSEKSSLSPSKELVNFLCKNISRSSERILYKYFYNSVSFASVCLILGAILLFGGFFWGGWLWFQSLYTGIPRQLGSIMIASISIICGIIFIINFINNDILNDPSYRRD